MTRRHLCLAGLAALGAFTASACSSDPALWNAMAMGLTEVADEMAWENANCHWGPMPGGDRYGPQRRYCPGDHGYAPPVALPPSYYKRRDHGRRGDDGRGRRD